MVSNLKASFLVSNSEPFRSRKNTLLFINSLVNTRKNAGKKAE